MKKVLIAVLILINFSAFADITVTEESSGATYVTYFSKNITAHYTDGQVTNITDMKKGLIYVINPMKRTYYLATFKQMKAFADKAADQMKSMADNPDYKMYMDQMSGGKVNVNQTGTKKIAGYTCTEFKLADKVSTSVICLSKSLTKAIKREVDTSRAEKIMDSLDMDGMGDIMGKKIADLEGKYGYLMYEKTTSAMPGMGMENQSTVVSVSKKRIDSSVFKVPEGFTKISMDDAIGSEY